jgi:hypothetical protein
VEKEQPYRRALVCFQCDEQLRMVKKKKKRMGWRAVGKQDHSKVTGCRAGEMEHIWHRVTCELCCQS